MQSKVYKFGGASVKNAEAVKNITHILKLIPYENLVIVVSAMGKTTNALEVVVNDFFNQSNKLSESIKVVEDYHAKIVSDLFPDKNHKVYHDVKKIFKFLYTKVQTKPSSNYNFEYDQIICCGELLSTKIISNYLIDNNINIKWIDARKFIKTDTSYREAKVDFKKSQSKAKKYLILKIHPFISHKDLLLPMIIIILLLLAEKALTTLQQL